MYNRRASKKYTLSSKNQNDIQNEIPEIIYNKFSNESSIVVNEIIEKIISLVISTNFTNNIDKQLSSSCFNFIKYTIENYLSSNFMSHDKDETYHNSFNNSKSEIIPELENMSVINELPNIDSSNINNNLQSDLKLEEQFFFNNYSHGENDWDMMDEPVSNKFDRYAHTMIKFKEIQREKNFKYNKNAEVLEEVDEESEKNSVNHINNDKNEITQIKIKDSPNKKNKDNNTNNKNKKKNLMDIMNQFSYHDLDDNNDLYIEPKEINYEKLRKEAQEKQIVVNEEKKIIKNAKKEVENKIKAEAEKNKQYVGKKITVDANGQIVFIKGIKIDKLNKEFNLLRTGTKLIKDEEKEKEKEKKPKKKKKVEEVIKDDKIKDNNNNANKEEADKNKATDDKSQKAKPTKLLPKIKNKFRSSLKDNLDEASKSRILKRLEEGPIILSGSNFDIMNMEVGVSIKENEKFKTGGKDFYHKYNKYSMANYNKQLKETTEVNSFLKTHAEVENPMTKSDINYMGNFTDTYNSSIGFINNSNMNQQITTSNKNYQLTNYNTLSHFGNRSLFRTKELNTSLSPHLKLSVGRVSLVGSMEKLNLITERQERLVKKTENIFKKNFPNYSSAKEFILPKLEEINKFTSEILTSNNWMKKSGINNAIGSPFRNPEKPGFKQISREMGIRGKILRNRMKNNVQRPEEISPALEAVDFFKNN